MGDLSIQASECNYQSMALRPGNRAVLKDPITLRSGLGVVVNVFTKFYMSSNVPLSKLGHKAISYHIPSLKIGPGVWTTWNSKTLDWFG